ncbi:hypothetical protein V8E51_018062 [Hyaloscypha variabilis]
MFHLTWCEKAASSEVDFYLFISLYFVPNYHPPNAALDRLNRLIFLHNSSILFSGSSNWKCDDPMLDMRTPIYFLSWLLIPLHVTVAIAHRPLSHPKLPQRPISFSLPSQHPILNPTPDDPSPIRGTINILSCGLDRPRPVTYSLSSQVCTPLISKLPYILEDLSQQLLSEHIDGLLFPFSESQQTSPLPTYLGANITEQLYRSRFVLSLSLKLSPFTSGLKGVGTPEWRSIIGLLEQSVQELSKGARGRDGAGLGSSLVLEADIEQVHVLAQWSVWKIIDGLPVMCEN